METTLTLEPKMETPKFQVTVTVECDSIFGAPAALAAMTASDLLRAVNATGSIIPMNAAADQAIERARELLS